MKKILSSLLVILISVTINAQIKLHDVSSIKNKHLEVPYATKSAAQKLDIYPPGKVSSQTEIHIYGF